MNIQYHSISGRHLIVIDDAFTADELKFITDTVDVIPESLWQEGHDDNLLRYSGIHELNVINGTDDPNSVIKGDCVFLNALGAPHKKICSMVDNVVYSAFSTKSIVTSEDRERIFFDKNEFFCRVLRYMPGYYDQCADDDLFLHTDISTGVMFTPFENTIDHQCTYYYEDDKFETPVLTLEHKPGRLVVFDGRIVHAPNRCDNSTRYAMSMHNDHNLQKYLSAFSE